MQKSLIIIQNTLGIAVLLLGIVVLFTVYGDSQKETPLTTKYSAEIETEEKYSTSTTSGEVSQNPIAIHPIKDRQTNLDERTTNEDDLKKEKETTEEPAKISSQNTVSVESNDSQKSEDQSYTRISDRVIATPGNVFPEELLAKYYSIKLTMKSPVDLQIYDEDGNYTGVLRKGDYSRSESNIPGSTIRSISGHQVITLQGDRSYNVVLEGMDTDYPDFERYDGDEPLTLEAKVYYGDEIVEELLFSAPPVTPQTKGNMTISNENTFSVLELDYDGDGQVDSLVESTDSEDE